MAKGKVSNVTGDRETFAEQAGPLIVGPLARKIAYEAERLERALDGFRFELQMNLDVMKREILQHVGDLGGM